MLPLQRTRHQILEPLVPLVIMATMLAPPARADTAAPQAPASAPAERPDGMTDEAALPAGGSTESPRSLRNNAAFHIAARRQKTDQVALQAYGGSLLGSSLGSTFLVGTRLMVFVARQIGIGAGYSFSRIGDEGDFGVGQDLSVHIANAQVELSTDSALRIAGKTILETDLFATLGAGAFYEAGHWEATGIIGGGIRIYPSLSWLAIQVEVLNFLHRTQRVDGSRFETDVAFTFGAALLLPPR